MECGFGKPTERAWKKEVCSFVFEYISVAVEKWKVLPEAVGGVAEKTASEMGLFLL
jgi:hypothetical protein